MKEFLIKQMLIILKTFLLYKPLQFFFQPFCFIVILIGSIAILRFVFFFYLKMGMDISNH